jgi:hypothetical protein
MDLPELLPGTFVARRNSGNDYLIDRGLQRAVSWTGVGHSNYEQDMAVTTSQGPIADRTDEYLGTGDVVIVALRRLLLNAAEDLQNGIEPRWAQRPEAYRVRSVDLMLPKDVSLEDGTKEWIEGSPQVWMG